jgi:glycosyltransferase involved in cell wall biosynthesis
VVLRALARVDPSLLGRPALLAAGPPGRGAGAIEEEAAGLGLGHRVRFAGFVPGDDLPVLLAASRALVHPSRDEGFGLTPVEAMAAGVPALASAAGAVPEVTAGAAVLLDPEDADAWAEAITAVAADPDHHAALVAAGAERQAMFTWARAAEATRAVHREVLAS